MSGSRLLVFGSREWTDYATVFGAIRHICPAVIIHGDARGADRLAGRAAAELDIPVDVFPARWKDLGRRAGVLRNQEMLDQGKPDAALGFHDSLERSRGSRDMALRLLRRGITPTIIYHAIGGPWSYDVTKEDLA